MRRVEGNMTEKKDSDESIRRGKLRYAFLLLFLGVCSIAYRVYFDGNLGMYLAGFICLAYSGLYFGRFLLGTIKGNEK